jgi:tricorn protease
LVESRGEIFTIPAEKGDTRNLTNSSGSADRDPAWSPDGRFISYFSDRSGEYKLYVEAQDGLTPPREIALAKPTHYYTPSWSPDSKKLLFTDTNLKVWVLDVATGAAEDRWPGPVDGSPANAQSNLEPGFEWVAYSSRLRSLFHAIFISNAETGESKQVTDGLSDAVWPVWDANGKYLWFLASTDFGLRSQWLDMTSYDRETNYGLYLAVLKKGDASPLLPESDEDKGMGGPAETAGRGRTATSASSCYSAGRFRWYRTTNDLHTRRPERQYSQLTAGADGTVFYLEAAGTGQGPGGGSTLHRYRLSDRRAAPFVNGVAAYSVSGDGKKLVYRTGGGGGGQGGPGAQGGPQPAPSLFLVDADRTVPQPGTGRLSYALRMYLEPKAEFKQIFNEGWRNQRDYLYVPNLHGTDWPQMREMYGAMLPYVMHRADLNYLLDMMGAEIAIGHSYVRGGDMPEVPNSPGGLLGADFAIENGRYRINPHFR